MPLFGKDVRADISSLVQTSLLVIQIAWMLVKTLWEAERSFVLNEVPCISRQECSREMFLLSKLLGILAKTSWELEISFVRKTKCLWFKLTGISAKIDWEWGSYFVLYKMTCVSTLSESDPCAKRVNILGIIETSELVIFSRILPVQNNWDFDENCLRVRTLFCSI